MKLSVWTGVGGCGCLVFHDVFLNGAACLVLMKRAQSFASAADDVTTLMTSAMFNTKPLIRGNGALLDMKKCPPALLLAFSSLKFEAFLWIAKAMLLALYVFTVSSCDYALSKRCTVFLLFPPLI